MAVAVYLLATKTSFLLRVYGTSFDENCGTACLDALQQQCAAPSSFKFISGVLPEKARSDTAGVIGVNLRETYILLSSK